jgi:multicomponent Na+:H+ antiporter subunit E
MTRSVGRIALLVVLWVLLWGTLSIANVLSGIAVAVGVVVLFPSSDRHRRAVVRPLSTLRLVGFVARELVVSNALLTRDVVRRHPDVHPGVVPCPLACTSPWVGALVANVVALSPGTMAVDMDVDAHVLTLHVLRLADPASTRRYVARLESLVVHAFGTAREIHSLTAYEVAR